MNQHRLQLLHYDHLHLELVYQFVQTKKYHSKKEKYHSVIDHKLVLLQWHIYHHRHSYHLQFQHLFLYL